MSDATDDIPGMAAVLARKSFDDSVVVGDDTQALLHQHNLLPSQWEIPVAEWRRITGANIKVGIVFPPASQLSLTTSGVPQGERIHVVAIQLKMIEAGTLSRRETLALILHEIGHIVNPYPPKEGPTGREAVAGHDTILLREMYADDYAKLCGLGKEIASSLEKCCKMDPNVFRPDQVQQRIERTANNVSNSIKAA